MHAELQPHSLDQILETVDEALRENATVNHREHEPSRPQSQHKIMIVDDEAVTVKIVRKHLQQQGYDKFISVTDPCQAMRLMSEERPDLVLLDIQMPGISGFEILQRIRAEEQISTTPVIILTAASDRETKLRALQLGATDFLHKPLDSTELIVRVRNVLAVKAHQDQLLKNNEELSRTNIQLSEAKQQLLHSNEELNTLNRELDVTNGRMRRHLEAAARIQQSLLPIESSQSDSEVSTAWRCSPCDELGGDFLNTFALDAENSAFFVVDVSGHGLASALLAVAVGRAMTPLASETSLLIRTVAPLKNPFIMPPAEVANELNRRFQMEQQGDLYFTMAYGVLHRPTCQFRFVCAGHPPLIHVDSSGQARQVKIDEFAIGWIDGAEYTDHVLQLQPGDRLFLYSDGIPEAMDHDLNQFGDERMLDVISRHAIMTLDQTVDALFNETQAWCKVNGPKDDISILAFEIRRS